MLFEIHYLHPLIRILFDLLHYLFLFLSSDNLPKEGVICRDSTLDVERTLRLHLFLLVAESERVHLLV
jgi:hypothetical protein